MLESRTGHQGGQESPREQTILSWAGVSGLSQWEWCPDVSSAWSGELGQRQLLVLVGLASMRWFLWDSLVPFSEASRSSKQERERAVGFRRRLTLRDSVQAPRSVRLELHIGNLKGRVSAAQGQLGSTCREPWSAAPPLTGGPEPTCVS